MRPNPYAGFPPLTIRPGDGIGPVRLGASRQEVEEILEKLHGADVETFQRDAANWLGCSKPETIAFGWGLVIRYDVTDHVAEVMVDPGTGYPFRLLDSDPSAVSASELLEAVGGVVAPDPYGDLPDGDLPEIGLYLWNATTDADWRTGETVRRWMTVSVSPAKR